MKELVSIIMPSYNTAKFIGESIESVINQTYNKWELIIVDDCSTDNTDTVVKKYLKDNRIKYLKNKQNSGAAISRNYALREAKGKWIAFLDSDDLWASDKLEKQIEFMKNNNYVFSYTNYRTIDEGSNDLRTIVSGPKKVTKSKMYNYCYPGCLTVMYDGEKIGLVQIKNIKKNNDYAMWLVISKKANCYLLPETLAKYRVRGKSISHDKLSKKIKSHYELFRVCDEKSSVVSFWYTSWNMFHGIIKKVRYVRKG